MLVNYFIIPTLVIISVLSVYGDETSKSLDDSRQVRAASLIAKKSPAHLTKPYYPPINPRMTWKAFQENDAKNERRDHEENKHREDRKRARKLKLLKEIRKVAQLATKIIASMEKLSNMV